MKRISIAAAAAAILFSVHASATVPIRIQDSPPMAQTMISNQLQNLFGNEALRLINVRQVTGAGGELFLIVRLHSSNYHKFETVKIELNGRSQFTNVIRNYRLQSSERKATHDQADMNCPDETTEFISFAPNGDIQLEQDIAKEVAAAASARGLKTVLLLGQDATRQAYLNYMSCPNLKGNFYDGDSNPNEMITVDDSITADDYKIVLKEKFRFKVTNIWLACEAFNDPMLSSVLVGAQAQKYAAGKNDLQVGPSDKAAACAMEAAISGQAMTAAFQDCYQRIDVPTDQWGFDGQGSDFLGQ